MTLRRERYLLGLRFVLVVVFAAWIAYMLSRGWVEGTFGHGLVVGVATLLDIEYGSPLQLLSSTAIGFVLGTLAVFTLDWRKRIQGTLLLIGTLVGLFVLGQFGVLIPNVDWSFAPNVLAVLLGVGMGILPHSRALSRQSGTNSLSTITVDSAIRAVFVMFSGLAIAGLVQTVLAGTSMILDFVVTGGFVYLLNAFISSDADWDAAVLGTTGTGKTMLLYGLYTVFSRRYTEPADPDSSLKELLVVADNTAQGDPFPAEHTREVEPFGFAFQAGQWFPTRVKFSTHDYQGELLERIGEQVSRRRRLSRRLRGPEGQLARRIRSTDLAVLVLDMARVLDGDTDYFDNLFTIGTVVKKNGGHILLVATKCDLVLERYASFSSFADEQFVAEELLYPDGSGIQSFAEWVTENLASREQVNELLKLADYDLVHPVYYRTTTTPNGSLVPALDDFGALQPVGFERLADILEEEALSNVRL